MNSLFTNSAHWLHTVQSELCTIPVHSVIGTVHNTLCIVNCAQCIVIYAQCTAPVHSGVTDVVWSQDVGGDLLQCNANVIYYRCYWGRMARLLLPASLPLPLACCHPAPASASSWVSRNVLEEARRRGREGGSYVTGHQTTTSRSRSGTVQCSVGSAVQCSAGSAVQFKAGQCSGVFNGVFSGV